MIKKEWENYFIIFYATKKLPNLMTFNYSIKSLKVKGSEYCALKDCRGKCSLCPRHTGLQSDSRAQLSPTVTTGGKP